MLNLLEEWALTGGDEDGNGPDEQDELPSLIWDDQIGVHQQEYALKTSSLSHLSGRPVTLLQFNPIQPNLLLTLHAKLHRVNIKVALLCHQIGLTKAWKLSICHLNII